ncbi:Rpn family recombination-promoting nuclease/putative transposase [Allocoprobacillus halotolerans]|uniref:Rpn family recombination-promoting nuclease/putative transposase n=1 Tax=Allocoprobacillus halotolerans TaxID=2944914 RepID=A0ABY5I5X0_9FIRM|nr:Rpn family recombination-promoting nuclease/putative transposase [Allocoprobacillus halotolerans]UTY40731.1 Rpn family recombination-promoting nuclease/putative transposase [Allocoprobacillus halotolerans]
MGLQKDHIFKDFFKDAKRFADMMNAILYGGQNVIQPEELQLMDSNEIFVGKYISKERRRDVIMLWKGKDFQAILALEAQSQVDFTMVSRTLLYDALTYNMQDKNLKDHMFPYVISIVLFHGKGRWTSKTSLLERVNVPKGIKHERNDWKMNVVDIKDLDYHLLRNEDNRNVVKTIGTIWRKEKEDFKGMEVSKAAARVIAILTERFGILDLVEGDEGTVAMWSFWQDIEDSGMKKGVQQGKMETLKMILTSLFGKLTPELTLKIELSNEERLNKLALHISDIHSETDVYKILE